MANSRGSPPSRQGLRRNGHSRAAGAEAPSRGTLRHNRTNGIASIHTGDPHQQGPRVWLRQPAGAAAPSGGSEPHEVGNVGALFIPEVFPAQAARGAKAARLALTEGWQCCALRNPA